MKQPTHKSGFTLIEIMIVIAIIGMLAAIAIPSFIHARETAQIKACIVNLQTIDGAIQLWATETGAGEGAPVTSANITPYINRGPKGSLKRVYCPIDPAKTFETSYTIVDTSTEAVCKIAPAKHSMD
jgi:prepilin-type N-terminal cleavage/methylation domain-containing protein